MNDSFLLQEKLKKLGNNLGENNSLEAQNFIVNYLKMSKIETEYGPDKQ